VGKVGPNLDVIQPTEQLVLHTIQYGCLQNPPPGSQEEREGLAAGGMHTEIFPLTLFAVGGMMLFPASNDLLTMFVALEVLSLPLYLLCGLARRRRLLSHEAAMKYFLLGSFSSAFFLFGIAMLYGYSGSVSLASIASEASSGSGSDTLLFGGIALTGVGLLFKIGAVPFQSWKPDVYQGAPTPITAPRALAPVSPSMSLMESATCPLTASPPKKNPATAIAMTIMGPSEKIE